MREVALVAAVLAAAVTACGGDEVSPTPPPPLVITATGSLTARFPAPAGTVCRLAGAEFSFALAPDGSQSSVSVVVHAYHGVGGYTEMLGPDATTGVSIDLDSSGPSRWVAGGGVIDVLSRSADRIDGDMDVTLRPYGGAATGTVHLSGHWACTLSSPGTASPSP